jgi:2-oxoglutarate ferredoxin oxidoreductase subunit delta
VSKEKGTIVLIEDRCKGCGLCASVCPSQHIQLSRSVNSQGINVAICDQNKKCTGCTFCAMICPDVAIEVYKDKIASKS